MQIIIGQVYFFVKSGNRVRVLEKSSKKDEFVVERIEGAAKSKQMIVRRESLVERFD